MGALSSDEARRVAESLWHVEWVSDTEGYTICPGNSRHTKANAPTDCRLMLEGGKPPTIFCVHASCRDDVDAANFRLRSALGKAETTKGWVPPERDWHPPSEAAQVKKERPKFDPEKLGKFAGSWAGVVDLAWLANRSVLEPSRMTSHDFLTSLYRPEHGEKVVIFTKEFSQGQALWPGGHIPTTGKNGVWFLAQPVDGEYRPNPRRKKDEEPKMSRRSAESVRDWRFMVLESDDAPPRLWLGAVAQLPLRVSAIYTSGGRSIHVLIRVDARIKEEWEEEKAALLHGLLTLGACPGALSGVRLTRLPGCWREGKTNADGTYMRFPEPRYQKLLYINPAPVARPIVEIIPRRDVLEECRREGDAIAERFSSVGEGIIRMFHHRAWYYAPVSEFCKKAEAELRPHIAEMDKAEEVKDDGQPEKGVSHAR